MAAKFYRFIHNSMGILLGWGILNILAGLTGAVFARSKFGRQFWLQCLGWGLVNSFIAGISQNSYRKKLARLAETGETAGEGEVPSHEVVWTSLEKEVRNIFLILLVNVFLDLSYILGGWWLRSSGKSKGNPGKAGMGTSITGQGLFLFGFDGVLSFIIGRRWRS
ncbi:MAG: hypothetical protein J0I20_02120 [Chloroflexi bacterium]|nr:hypothetical protein [Chloroflexota bacterium]OJV89432.1 MAG: hypothetical protein BGO39_36260 [Chloroflexi bacterium 54-19]